MKTMCRVVDTCREPRRSPLHFLILILSEIEVSPKTDTHLSIAFLPNYQTNYTNTPMKGGLKGSAFHSTSEVRIRQIYRSCYIQRSETQEFKCNAFVVDYYQWYHQFCLVLSSV